MVSLLHMTPDDTIATRLERSQRPGFSSRVRRIGLPNASPTIAIVLTPSRSIVSSSSTGSKVRLSSVTMLPPPDSVDRHGKLPVPCICGQAGRKREPGAVCVPRRSSAVPSSSSALPERGVERDGQVVLAPHHALRHPGRAAGVEEVEVVAAAPPGGYRPELLRSSPPTRTSRPSRGTSPVPSSTHSHVRTLGNWSRIGPMVDGERAVEHDGTGVGVVPEVQEFVGGVPIVRVHRHERRLERGVHRLQVLRAVVEVLGHGLLTGEAGVEEVLGDPVGAAIDLTPAPSVVAVDQARGVGKIVGDDLPHVGEVPVSHPCTATRPARSNRVEDSMGSDSSGVRGGDHTRRP